MQYQSDYILRLIEQMGGLIRRALERLRMGEGTDEPLELTEQALGLVVEMDPRTFLRLAPQSMVAILEIGGFDPRVSAGVVEALEAQAEIYEMAGELELAAMRHEQAAAVRSASERPLS